MGSNDNLIVSNNANAGNVNFFAKIKNELSAKFEQANELIFGNQTQNSNFNTNEVLAGQHDEAISLLQQARENIGDDTQLVSMLETKMALEENARVPKKTIDELVAEAKEKIKDIPVGSSFEDLSEIIKADDTFDSIALDQYLTKCGMQHGLSRSQIEDLYELVWSKKSDFAEKKAQLQKLKNGLDEWNMLDDKITESTPITDENKNEIMEKFHIETPDDKKYFEEMFDTYDSEVVTTEDGKSIIRFKDEQGRPICDYTYGVNDGWTGRYKTIYTYAEDGSYKTQHYEQVCPYQVREDGTKIPMGWMDDAMAYAPFYYDSDGNLIEKPSKADKEKFQKPLGGKRPLYETHI